MGEQPVPVPGPRSEQAPQNILQRMGTGVEEPYRGEILDATLADPLGVSILTDCKFKREVDSTSSGF